MLRDQCVAPSAAIGSAPWLLSRDCETMLLVLLGDFQRIIAYFILVAMLFVGLVVAGPFRLRTHHSVPVETLSASGNPVTALLFLSLVLLLLVLLAARHALQAALGCEVKMAGTPAYCLQRRRSPTQLPVGH